MENKEYNGWSNYETWLVALWLDNDQAIQEDVQIICNKRTKYEFNKADELREYVEELVYLDEASLRTDLINSALCVVNWAEIVNSMKGGDSK